MYEKRNICVTIALSIFILILGFSPLRSTQLLDISVHGTTEKTVITASFDQPANFTEFAMEDKLMFDLLKMESGLEANKFEGINSGGVSSITLIPFYTANLLRLTIGLTEPVAYSASIEGNQLIVSFSNPTGVSFEPWTASKQAITSASLGYEEAYEVPGLISLDLEDADIQTILRAMAHYGSKNIVAGEEVKGTITIKLTNVSWKQAFDVIVKTAGFSYREEENIIRVSPGTTFDKERESDELAQPSIHRVYKLSFANPGEVEKTVSEMLSNKGTVKKDERTNSLIVTDIKSRHDDVSELIKILDAPNPQVDIEVKVVDLDYEFSRELGITWMVTNLRSRRYNVEGSVEAAPYEGTIGYLDLNIGTVRNFAKLSALFSISESEGKAKIIANPRITALNNREAEILGGKKFPVNVFDEAGNVVTKYFEVGTKLRVTPHINSNDEITMDIDAELSNVDPTTLIITTTEAATRQLVKDGETVVLGGFIWEETLQSEQGIPFLRSIPILGLLFKKTGTKVTKREVLIFLTPHIIRYY